MTAPEATIADIEPLVQDVQDYVDSLLTRNDSARWQAVRHVSEILTLTESDLSDDLANVEDNQDRLARGDASATGTGSADERDPTIGPTSLGSVGSGITGSPSV
jgi:hypothetical protein